MKFCKYCGKEIDENAIFCSGCGTRVNGDAQGSNYQRPRHDFNPYGGYGYSGTYPVYNDRGSVLIAILSFLFWQCGLVLWFVWRYSRPQKARSAALGTLCNACIGMPVLGLVLWLVWKDELNRRDYAKVCGISAIIGASLWALLIGIGIVLKVSGLADSGFYFALPFDQLAFILR